MGYWRKGSTILALIILPQTGFPQRAVLHPEPRIDPRIDRPGERSGRDPRLVPDRKVWDPVHTLPPVTLEQRRQRERQTLQQIRDSAATENWTEVWELSNGISSAEAESFKLQAAKNLLADATRASAREDWKEARRLLQPLNETSADTAAPVSVFDNPSTSAALLRHPSERSLPVGIDRTGSLKNTLEQARTLYSQASVELAQKTLRAGDPRGAVPLFLEAFTIAPNQSPQTVALFKMAFLNSAEVNYAKHDWKSASELCAEIRKQRYFPLTPSESERIFLIDSRSQNWSQATNLPRGTLVLDFITTQRKGAYFQVFGAGGAVDLLVRANTIGELLGHPDFRSARDQIVQGSDLLLTPRVTDVPGWRESLRHGFPGTTIWSDPYIGEASDSLATLQEARLTPADFDLAVLLPKNATQQAAMGLEWTQAQREHAWASAEYLKSNGGRVSLVTRNTNRVGLRGWLNDAIGTDSKSDVMHSLANAKGVLILFAHGDREGVYTPEGKKLTVRDVRSLDLHINHPVVLLLSCEGNSRGNSAASLSLAQELKKSGATAVWSYGQKVDAGEASSAAVEFLESIRSGKTLLESFRLLTRDRAVKAGPEVHLKVQLQDLSRHS